MELTYKNIKEISQERLVDLFKSVEWESANYPAQLVQANKKTMEVFLALGIMISVLVWLLRWTIVSWLLMFIMF